MPAAVLFNPDSYVPGSPLPLAGVRRHPLWWRGFDDPQPHRRPDNAKHKDQSECTPTRGAHHWHDCAKVRVLQKSTCVLS